MPRPGVSFREALLFWLRLGFISFGGPSGQIAVMHQEVAERRRWISNERFPRALNYCMLLPGPEAWQLAIYVGWLLHRTAGGLAAESLIVGSGSLLMLALCWLHAAHGHLFWVEAIFYGLRAAVVPIVATSSSSLELVSKTSPLASPTSARPPGRSPRCCCGTSRRTSGRRG